MKYLYRISTKQDSVWSRVKPKPVYFVANSQAEAVEWASRHLTKGLTLSKVICLAECVGTSVFTGI
jgi:hypothetical protein